MYYLALLNLRFLLKVGNWATLARSAKWAMGKPRTLWKTATCAAPLITIQTELWLVMLKLRNVFYLILAFQRSVCFLGRLIHQSHHEKYNEAFKKSEIKSIYGL